MIRRQSEITSEPKKSYETNSEPKAHTHTRRHAHAHTQTHTHTNTQTRTRTYTHTHTHTCTRSPRRVMQRTWSAQEFLRKSCENYTLSHNLHVGANLISGRICNNAGEYAYFACAPLTSTNVFKIHSCVFVCLCVKL